MHVLFVTHGYKPAYRIGGPATSVSMLAEGLVRNGIRVTVLTTNSNLDEKLDVEPNTLKNVDGVEVFYADVPVRKSQQARGDTARSMGFLYSPEIGRMLGEIKSDIDLIHTHIPFVYPTLYAGLFSIRHKIPLVYHQRGVLSPARLQYKRLKKLIYVQFFERRIIEHASHLIALTHAEVDSYRRLSKTTPISVIPNGIDTEMYKVSHEKLKGGLNGAETGTTFLFLGRLHPTKGTRLLLDAFLRAQNYGLHNAKLVFAGPDESGFQHIAEELISGGMKNGNEVRFCGMLNLVEKQRELSRANAFLLPSVGEGLSMAMLEAMASGCALLISPGCNLPDAAALGVGEVVPLDVDRWARAIYEFSLDHVRVQRMGIRSREAAILRYSWPSIVGRFHKLYNATLLSTKYNSDSLV